MSNFSDLMSRADAAGELPLQLAQELVTGTTRDSTALSLCRSVPTTTRSSYIPVLSALPQAYNVSDPAGLKQTTGVQIANEPITAEEIATICPIPQSVVEDSQYDLWAAVKPLLTQAMAKKVDNMVLFGVDKPSTWGDSMVEAAVAAGAVVADPPTDGWDGDPAPRLLAAAMIVSSLGYTVSGSVVRPGWQYQAAGFRTHDLVNNPVGANTPYPLLIAGMGIHVDPLRWDWANDAIVADWSNCVIGLRQDIKLETFDSGVISDADGKVVLNLMQQDSVAVRVTMRLGFRVNTPPTDTDPNEIGLTALSPVAVVPAAPTTGVVGLDVRNPVARKAAARKPANGRRHLALRAVLSAGTPGSPFGTARRSAVRPRSAELTRLKRLVRGPELAIQRLVPRPRCPA